MKTAQDIINNARAEIITHIVTLMRKIDAYLETGNKQLITNSEKGVWWTLWIAFMLRPF